MRVLRANPLTPWAVWHGERGEAAAEEGRWAVWHGERGEAGADEGRRHSGVSNPGTRVRIQIVTSFQNPVTSSTPMSTRRPPPMRMMTA